MLVCYINSENSKLLVSSHKTSAYKETLYEDGIY